MRPSRLLPCPLARQSRRDFARARRLVWGSKPPCPELGVEARLTVHADAMAPNGMARRRGLGKVIHLAVADLWIHAKVATKELDLAKVNRNREHSRHVEDVLGRQASQGSHGGSQLAAGMGESSIRCSHKCNSGPRIAVFS